MNYFFYRLNAPRPTFAADMTAEEGALMGVHAQYWRELVANGTAIVVGPVLDPKASFGMAVVRLEEGADPSALGNYDPVITANKGFTFEIFPMPRVMLPEEE